MDTKTFWQANRDQVSFERFDDDLVLVHFETGNYYSFNRTGADAWALLEGGTTHEAICRALAGAGDVSAGDVSDDVARFLDALRDDGLILPAEGRAPTPAAPAAGPYEPPAFERFTDMQELLLLDPIHEVDATGWPHRKPDEAGG
jgi:hypothetical protein